MKRFGILGIKCGRGEVVAMLLTTIVWYIFVRIWRGIRGCVCFFIAEPSYAPGQNDSAEERIFAQGIYHAAVRLCVRRATPTARCALRRNLPP